ncbi:MAG: alpha-galactosidase [Planctomycetes bacterium]|nr:alpha-galactosidase [Planctomycetota bacterium]
MSWPPTMFLAFAVAAASLPSFQARPSAPDWLSDPRPYGAEVRRSSDSRSLVLENGIARREFLLEPGTATIGLDVRSSRGTDAWRAVLRAVEPEARLVLDGISIDVGGLEGQVNRAFLRTESGAGGSSDLEPLAGNPRALQRTGFEIVEPAERFPWKRVRRSGDAPWPPRGKGLRLDFGVAPDSLLAKEHPELVGLVVRVHHELYDGLPCFAKWIEVHNGTAREIRLEHFWSELLAAVEGESKVETRPGIPYRLPNLWVETDYACGGSDEDAQRFGLRWVADPRYTSQVNYLLQTPCLLECGPAVGPDQTLAPGATFESFRTFLLLHDSEDRSRNGLARCRMYRTIAPWTSENPLMMHVTSVDPSVVAAALEQCAAVGFELAILSFGSGFDLEDERAGTRERWRGFADLARQRGLELGGYSLLSSRSVGNGDDVVSPPGERPAHGSCPSLASAWGQEYLRRLRDFFPATGFTMLEHDGPYPGDYDTAARPPLQKGLADSQWVQFGLAARFYRWCRAQGIFVNAPDWYVLNGTNKSAMGYREVNWSLPRADQVLHTRQNIFDGTWTKTPSMGWMFVPLTEYQGGGAQATVEPLAQHLDHYQRMLESNLGAGVQACYRGPRLFDTEETRAMVARQVAWFRAHREVLEADIDHAASRRADGRDLDWFLHVLPLGDPCGMLVVYNPLQRDVERTLVIDLTNTGAREETHVAGAAGPVGTFALDRQGRVELPVRIPAGGMSWFEFRR